MRVELTRDRNDRGAIGIVSGVLAFFVLIGLAGFTVDFGAAYLAKRQDQTAADASALAAASVFANYTGSCGTLATNSEAYNLAQIAADDIRRKNRAQSNGSNVLAACSADGKSLDVSYSVSETLTTTLGAIFGKSSLAVTRSATANVNVPPGATGLRPYTICSFYVPTTSLPSAPVEVDFPSTSSDTGNCPQPGGNWFTLDCPHAGKANNGNPDLASATRDGCSHEVLPVNPVDNSSNSTRFSSLVAACPADVNSMSDYDPDCLSANPGNVGSGNLNDPTSINGAWQTLIGKKILFPVFCGTANCTPVGYVQGKNGNNSMYPVWKMAGAEVCGWHWGSKNSGSYSKYFPSATTDDKCYGTTAAGGAPNDNYLLLSFTTVLTSGDIGKSLCGLADDLCDGGARRVQLVK